MKTITFPGGLFSREAEVGFLNIIPFPLSSSFFMVHRCMHTHMVLAAVDPAAKLFRGLHLSYGSLIGITKES